METKNFPRPKPHASSGTTGLLRTTCVMRLLLLVLLMLPAVVQAQFDYTTENGTITITRYTGPGGVVAIPDTIDGLPVTSIGSLAFYGRTNLASVTIPDSVINIGEGALRGCTSLTSVTIGSGVTSIGDSAFYDCASLTNVTIPDSVTSIGDAAFWGCTSLTSVTIPGSVTIIGDYAFGGCTSLTAITVDVDNSTYGSVDGVLFNKSQTRLIRCPGDKTGSYTIPIGVISIGEWAFDGCYSLTSVTIPSSVTTIGKAAFAHCSSLTSVTIPSSVTSIGDQAFQHCRSLTSITIPGNVTIIYRLAFYGCTSLNGVYFQGNTPSFGSSLFGGNTPATVYYLPGTTGWGPTFGGRPTAPWLLPNPLILNNGPRFGVRTNQFGFVISWATNASVVVEASADLAQPVWIPVGTNTLTDGSSYFSDAQWTNHPARFYRLRSP